MNRLQELWDTTEELHHVLHAAMEAKDRETTIEQMNRLIERRSEIMKRLQPPFSEAENRLGKKLVCLNKQVQVQMDNLFDELKQEMRQMKKQKKSNRTYVNPYEHVQTMDGMFLDSKQ
ncbi:flagellar protein FliT [Lentibacillus lipolyticus]|nr:flagellar protein FliT [Lentibacillus lipolyticus]